MDPAPDVGTPLDSFCFPDMKLQDLKSLPGVSCCSTDGDTSRSFPESLHSAFSCRSAELEDLWRVIQTLTSDDL